jgi:hypothetical protein
MDRTDPLLTRHLSAIAIALIVACCLASVGYRAYLAKGFSEAAKSACADHNTFSGAYRTCLSRLS